MASSAQAADIKVGALAKGDVIELRLTDYEGFLQAAVTRVVCVGGVCRARLEQGRPDRPWVLAQHGPDAVANASVRIPDVDDGELDHRWEDRGDVEHLEVVA